VANAIEGRSDEKIKWGNLLKFRASREGMPQASTRAAKVKRAVQEGVPEWKNVLLIGKKSEFLKRTFGSDLNAFLQDPRVTERRDAKGTHSVDRSSSGAEE